MLRRNYLALSGLALDTCKCFHKIKAEGDFIQTHRAEGDVKTGERQPQAQECWGAPETGRGKEWIPSQSP